jgi:hypothetical protein
MSAKGVPCSAIGRVSVRNRGIQYMQSAVGGVLFLMRKLFEIISLFQTINDLFHPMKHFLAMV